MPTALTRQHASDAVVGEGWQFILGTLVTSVPVGSLAEALSAAQDCLVDAGAEAHLMLTPRPDRLEVTLRDPVLLAVTDVDVRLAQEITRAMHARGLETTPGVAARPLQRLEIAIDALDVAAVRPFWKAVLGYVDKPSGGSGLIDPLGESPEVWFQVLDLPRPQRNRVHIDVAVPHDQAVARVAAAIASGGVLVSDDYARAWWILADVEGNEVCVCTWQDRDGL